jgi:septum formation protein
LNKKIILASTSRYRRELLIRLQLPFDVVAPRVDETALTGEACADTALRLSIAKARVVAADLPVGEAAVVIGSDQVAELNGQAIGKPGTRENARAQLQAMRGNQLIFHTGLALVDAASGRVQSCVVPTTVAMRNYSDAAIEYYLDHENALDCAGSAKSEGLGAALIASMRSDDPTALVGLPLIALTSMLSAENIEVLSE